MFLPLLDWLGGLSNWGPGFGCGCGVFGNGWNSCRGGGFGGGFGGWRPGGCGPCAGYLSDRFGNGWNPGCWRGNDFCSSGFGDCLSGFW